MLQIILQAVNEKLCLQLYNMQTDVTLMHYKLRHNCIKPTLHAGHAIAQLVEVPRYKLKGRGFDS